MQFYYFTTTIEEGMALLETPKPERVFKGRTLSNPSGAELFLHLHKTGGRLKCWHCGVEASMFIANKGQRDIPAKSPILDLYAVDKVGRPILMTRDHIIPKSYGGSDDVRNLRVGCGPCNHGRGNGIEPEDIAFMRANPDLIMPSRIRFTVPEGAETVKKTEAAKGPAITDAERKAKRRAKDRARKKRAKAKKAAERLAEKQRALHEREPLSE